MCGFDPDDAPWAPDKPGNPAKKGFKNYEKFYKPLIESSKAESDFLFGAAQDQYGDILSALREGYGNARTNISEQGRVATQGIMDSQTQALGASQQAAINAGLSGSTAHSTANRGIAADTARALSGLNASLSQLYANLDVGQAGAEAVAMQGLANLFQNQSATELGYLGQTFGAINQTPIAQPQQDGTSQILSATMQALPFLAAGGI